MKPTPLILHILKPHSSNLSRRRKMLKYLTCSSMSRFSGKSPESLITLPFTRLKTKKHSLSTFHAFGVDRISMPPGLSTLNISRSIRLSLGTCSMTSVDKTIPKDLSAKGSFSASAKIMEKSPFFSLNLFVHW